MSDFQWTPELVERLPALVGQMNEQAYRLTIQDHERAFLLDQVEQLEGKLHVTEHALEVAKGRIAQLLQDREFEG